GSATFLSALVRASKLKPWKTKPSFVSRIVASWSSPRVETSTPSSAYVPDVGRSRQPRRFISVDLPEPDGPMIATYSPRAMVKVTPRSARTKTVPSAYVFVTSRTSIAAMPLLIAQRLDGVEPRGAVRGIGADRDAEDEADEAAERRERESLDEELQQHLPPCRADRLAQPDLARALRHAHEHDVQDADPGHEQRDRADEPHDDGDPGEDAVDGLRERLAVEAQVVDAAALHVSQPS